MEFNNNQLSQSVRNTVARLPQFETEVGQTVTRLDGDISARATKASDFMSALTSTNKGATKTELDALEASIDQKISDLNYIQFVTELPETGEEKYIYAVVQDIYDREGHQIVVLYIWRDSEEPGETGDWYLAGAFSINFDPNDYLLKTEAAITYLKLTGGTLTNGTAQLKLANTTYASNSGTFVFDVPGQYFRLYNQTTGATKPILFADYQSKVTLVKGSYLKDYTNNTTGTILDSTDKAVANGVASLDANAKVPVAQLPDLSDTYLSLSGGVVNGIVTVRNTNGNSEIQSIGSSNGMLRLVGGYGSENSGVYFIRGSVSDLDLYSNNASTSGLRIKNSDGSIYARVNGTEYKILNTSDKAIANGLATLDANAQVPIAQLPIDTTLSQTSTNLLDNATITNALMQAADTISRGMYEKSDNTATTSGSTITIHLQDTTTIYKIKPLIDSTIVFDTTGLSFPSTCWTTFYLIVDFSDGNVNLIWPESVTWGNISPSGTAMVRYMYSFMKPDDDNVWLGNEMQSWVRQ
jgi:hypothetical protein